MKKGEKTALKMTAEETALAELREQIARELWEKRNGRFRPDELEQQCGILRNLTNAALFFRREPEPQPIDLSVFSGELLDAAVILAATGGYLLKARISGYAAGAVDIAALRGILLNLAGNACRYSDDGKASVTIKLRHKSMSILVANTCRKQLAFFQKPSTMGLAAALRGVSLCGGRLCWLREESRIAAALQIPFAPAEQKSLLPSPAAWEYLADWFSPVSVGLADIRKYGG